MELFKKENEKNYRDRPTVSKASSIQIFVCNTNHRSMYLEIRRYIDEDLIWPVDP